MPIAVGIYLPLSLDIPILTGGLIRYFLGRRRRALARNTSGKAAGPDARDADTRPELRKMAHNGLGYRCPPDLLAAMAVIPFLRDELPVPAPCSESLPSS